jgi:hypothetical protein
MTESESLVLELRCNQKLKKRSVQPRQLRKKSMSSSSRDSFTPPPPLDWKFSQVFGETTPGEDLQDG